MRTNTIVIFPLRAALSSTTKAAAQGSVVHTRSMCIPGTSLSGASLTAGLVIHH